MINNFVYNFFIFPGFLFAGIIGLLSSWFERKLTARLQFRVGPPIFQPFYDLLKLANKEILLPKNGDRFIFLAAPLAGLAAASLAITILGNSFFGLGGFRGDLIVLIYLLTIPALAAILGGAASKNPLSSLGASREMKLVLSYELPFIISLLVPVIKSGTIQMEGILSSQVSSGIFIGSLSGIIAFLVMLFSVQAKLGLVPFDIAEAEGEIIAGPYLEYSGFPLLLFKLTRMILLFCLPLFLILLFLGGIEFSGWHIITGILKYILILFLIVVIKNTNPRLRIDQALRFFWGPLTLLSILAVLLAILGL